MTTAEQIKANLALAHRFVEGALGGADPAAFDEIVADDIVVDSGLKPTGKITSKAEYGAVIGATLGADFTEASLEIKDIAALVDGRILVRFEASALNSGPVGGVAATGKRFTFCEMHLLRFEHGKLVENWVGALNPLMFEIWQAPVTAPLLFEDGHGA